MTAKQIVARVRLNVVSTMLLACLLTVAACARQADLGSIGDGPASVLWRGTFEPGDLSEWTADGAGGVYTQNVDIPDKPAATLAMMHNGRYSGVFTVASTASMASTSYLFRNQPSPPQAYYSAWFYVPSTITLGAWLSLSHFSGSGTGDGKNLLAIWDVNLYTLPGGGGLAAQLYDYVHLVNTRAAVPVPFPLDAWTRLEVYVSKAAGLTGEITVWQDGVQILQRSNVATVANDWMQWDAGAAADATLPAPANIYMDDAAISLVRLGPGS